MSKYHPTGKPTYLPTDPNKIPDLLNKITADYIKIEK